MPKNDDLLDAYFDDRLDEVGSLKFAARVQADPVFRAAFAAQCQREVALRAVLKVQHQAQQVAATSARLRRRHARRRPVGRQQWAMAAGVLLLIGVIIANSLAVRSHPDLTLVDIVAAVGSTRADDLTRPSAPGDRLLAGDELQIGSAATLRHRASGANLELIGPGRITAATDGLYLTLGQASISVPPQHRRAFRMVTPQVEIFVIGTRFNVDAAGERTSVDVTEGIVEVRWATGMRQLHAGESASWPALAAVSSPTAIVPLPVPIAVPVAVPAAVPAAVPTTVPTPTTTELPGVIGFEFFHVVSGETLPGGKPPTVPDRSPVAVRALTRGEVRSVRFDITGPDADDRHRLIEQFAPFIYPGDDHAEVNATWILEPGTYRVSAQGFSDRAGTVELGTEYVISFNVGN